MAQVGHFGAIKFYTKIQGGRLSVLSFSDAKWSSSVNLEEHRRQGKKPIMESVDRNSDEFTMTIYVSAFQQQSPMMVLKELRSYCLWFKDYPLSIGGQRIGSHHWLIADVSNDLQRFYKNGKLLIVGITVTFKETPQLKKASKKKKVSQSKKKSAKSSKQAKNTKSDNLLTNVRGARTDNLLNDVRNPTSKSIYDDAKKKGYSVYKAKKNTTLWAIAKEKYKDGSKYKKIYNANKTKAKGFHQLTSISEAIQKGWVLKIPA